MTAISPQINVLKMPLTNLQLELLKIFSYQMPEPELLEIKKVLANHFAKKAMDRMDKIWEEKGLSNEIMEEWLNEENQ